MKKIIALLLAVIMVMSLAIVVSADETAETTTYTDASTVVLKKTYTAAFGGTNPEETFTFSALTCTGVTDAGVGVTAANAPVPTIGTVTFNAGEATATKEVTITLPTYTAVGVYTYTFNEIAGNTAGVTYNTQTITLVVSVLQDPETGKIRVAAVHTEGEGEDKNDTFENVYDAGKLTVGKEVTGNLGDREKEFTVTVTFTAPANKVVKEAISYTDGTAKTVAVADWVNGVATATIVLKHGETVQFTNIPEGVTYVVAENDYTAEADGGYDEAEYDGNEEGAIVGGSDITTIITNNKDQEIDTGVFMDSVPFVVMAVVAVLGVVAITAKKRVQE